MKKTRAITSCLLTGVLMLAASGLISQAKAGVALAQPG